MSKKKKSKKKRPKRTRNFKNRFALKEYSPQEMETVSEFLEFIYGPCEMVVHDNEFNKLHVDINIHPPDEMRPYWKLVTVGMGAHKMKIPEGYEDVIPKRCELVLAVEPTWTYDGIFKNGCPMVEITNYGDPDKPNNYRYPFELLRKLAFIPIEDHTFLSPGHSIDLVRLEDTNLCGALILDQQDVPDDENYCLLPNGEEVEFYQVVPLTRDEMERWLKLKNSEEKTDFICHLPYVTRKRRKSVLK